jgi:hypothetical protein
MTAPGLGVGRFQLRPELPENGEKWAVTRPESVTNGKKP